MAKFDADMRSLLHETGLREAYARKYGMAPFKSAEHGR